MIKLYKYDVDWSHIPETCLDTFFNSLKAKIPSFATREGDVLKFSESNIHDEFQMFVDNFNCEVATEEIKILDSETTKPIIMESDPTIYINPPETGIMWINKNTGQIFICTSNETNKNIWVSSKTGRVIRPIPPADKFDFFEDGKTLAFYQFDNSIVDIGGEYPATGKIDYTDGVVNQAISSASNKSIKIQGLPIDEITDGLTVSSWVNWGGHTYVMPFGFDTYDIYVTRGYLGFNTARGDLTGIDFSRFMNKWVYLSATFKSNQLGEIYINGIKQTLDKTIRSFDVSNANITNQLSIFGWNRGTSYRRFGKIDRLRLYNGTLTEAQQLEQYNAEKEFINQISEVKN